LIIESITSSVEDVEVSSEASKVVSVSVSTVNIDNCVIVT